MVDNLTRRDFAKIAGGSMALAGMTGVSSADTQDKLFKGVSFGHQEASNTMYLYYDLVASDDQGKLSSVEFRLLDGLTETYSKTKSVSGKSQTLEDVYLTSSKNIGPFNSAVTVSTTDGRSSTYINQRTIRGEGEPQFLDLSVTTQAGSKRYSRFYSNGVSDQQGKLDRIELELLHDFNSVDSGTIQVSGEQDDPGEFWLTSDKVDGVFHTVVTLHTTDGRTRRAIDTIHTNHL